MSTKSSKLAVKSMDTDTKRASLPPTAASGGSGIRNGAPISGATTTTSVDPSIAALIASLGGIGDENDEVNDFNVLNEQSSEQILEMVKGRLPSAISDSDDDDDDANDNAMSEPIKIFQFDARPALDGGDDESYLASVDFSGIEIGRGDSAPILAESFARQRALRMAEKKRIAAVAVDSVLQSPVNGSASIAAVPTTKKSRGEMGTQAGESSSVLLPTRAIVHVTHQSVAIVNGGRSMVTSLDIDATIENDDDDDDDDDDDVDDNGNEYDVANENGVDDELQTDDIQTDDFEGDVNGDDIETVALPHATTTTSSGVSTATAGSSTAQRSGGWYTPTRAASSATESMYQSPSSHPRPPSLHPSHSDEHAHLIGPRMPPMTDPRTTPSTRSRPIDDDANGGSHTDDGSDGSDDDWSNSRSAHRANGGHSGNGSGGADGGVNQSLTFAQRLEAATESVQAATARATPTRAAAATTTATGHAGTASPLVGIAAAMARSPAAAAASLDPRAAAAALRAQQRRQQLSASHARP